MSDATPRCPRCGEVLPDADPSTPCPRCGAAPPPLPVEPELVILDEPEADEVPVVQPARVEPLPESLPEARPLPDPRLSVYPLPRPSDEPLDLPKPRIGLAMLVILLLVFAACGGVFVITYAIWAGFKRVAPKSAEVTADVRPVPPLGNIPVAR